MLTRKISKRDDAIKNLKDYGPILFKNRPQYIIDRIISLMLEEKAQKGVMSVIWDEKLKLKDGSDRTVSHLVYLNVFENLDEIVQSGDATHSLLTLQFIDFLYKNFQFIDTGKKDSNMQMNPKKEVAHFMISAICFFLKAFQKLQGNDQTTQMQTEKEMARLRVLSTSYDSHSATPANLEPFDKINLTKSSVQKILENSRNQLAQYVGNEEFVRVCDFHYLMMLFESINLFEEKIKIMEFNGRKLDIIREYFSNNRVPQAIDFCKKYEKEADLAIILLKLLCTPNVALTKEAAYPNYITEVLNLVNEQKVYQPHFVLKILKKNDSLPWGAVKFYLTNLISKKQTDLAEADKKLKQNILKIEEKQKQIWNFETKSFLVQPNICTLCKGRMNNPAIYFLCGHFYHKNCVYENTCPECVRLSERRSACSRRKTEGVFEQPSGELRPDTANL